jgi:hypothetical protein
MGKAREGDAEDVQHERDVGHRFMHLLPHQLLTPATRGGRSTLARTPDSGPVPSSAARFAIPVTAVAAIMIKSATIIAPPAGLCLGTASSNDPAG